MKVLNFFVKNSTVVYCTNVNGKKYSGARDFKFLKHVNNVVYFILKLKKIKMIFNISQV